MGCQRKNDLLLSVVLRGLLQSRLAQYHSLAQMRETVYFTMIHWHQHKGVFIKTESLKQSEFAVKDSNHSALQNQ